MDQKDLKNQLASSLKQWLDEYKQKASLSEMDFEVINAVCALLQSVDSNLVLQKKKENLLNTIVVNPDGKIGNILFFLDPSEL
jgi:cell division FtsZ-interacting protein ZapD